MLYQLRYHFKLTHEIFVLDADMTDMESNDVVIHPYEENELEPELDQVGVSGLPIGDGQQPSTSGTLRNTGVPVVCTDEGLQSRSLPAAETEQGRSMPLLTEGREGARGRTPVRKGRVGDKKCRKITAI